jgi:hypothetical protein
MVDGVMALSTLLNPATLHEKPRSPGMPYLAAGEYEAGLVGDI